MIKRSLLYLAAFAFTLVFAGGEAVGQSSRIQPRPRTTTSIVPVSPAVVRDPNSGLLKLVDQSITVGPNGVWAMKVSVPDLEPGHTAVLNLHDRSRSRIGFQNTLNFGQLGTVLDSSGEISLEELPHDPNGAITFRVDLNDGALTSEPGQVRLQRDGIYPVVLELRDAEGDVLDRLITHLIKLPEAQEGDVLYPLRVALGIDLRVAPAHQPDDTVRISDQARNYLSGYLDAFAQAPEIPVAIRYNPETLEALESSQNVTDQVLYETLQARRSIDLHIAGPYVDIQRAALTEQGLEQDVEVLVQRGAAVLENLVPGSVSPYTWISEDPISDEEALILWNEGKRRLVLPQSALQAHVPAPSITPRLPFNLNLEGSNFRVFALDNGLQTYFSSNERDDPVLEAHYLIAELSMLFFDEPGQLGGAVIVPPRTWDPNPVFLSTLLDGLARSQLLEPVSMDKIFQLANDKNEAGEKVGRALAEPVSQELLAERSDYDLTVQRLSSFGSMVDDAAGAALVRHLEEQLPISFSTDLTPEQQTEYWTMIRSSIDAEILQIEAPPPTSFTLTAREDEIPLRFRNRSKYPLKVRIEIISDKLDFPKGSTLELTLEADSVIDHNVSVQVRSPGTFPVRVRVLTADGEMPIAESRITIRSSVLSGAGVAMTAVALLILMLWWGRHLVKTHRAKKLSVQQELATA